MLKILVATFFCVSITVTVHADPLILTGGQFSSTGGSLPVLTWELQGPNFSTSGSTSEGLGFIPFLADCGSPCPANAPITLKLFIGTGPNISVTFNGFSATGSFLHAIGARFNVAIPFSVPTDMLGSVTVTAPFSNFTGSVSVIDSVLLNGTPPFTVEFVGSGTATAQFRVFSFTGSDRHFELGAVTLTFTPVPEPATLWLIAGGLAGLGTMLKRIRSTNDS